MTIHLKKGHSVTHCGIYPKEGQSTTVFAEATCKRCKTSYRGKAVETRWGAQSEEKNAFSIEVGTHNKRFIRKLAKNMKLRKATV